MTRKDFIKIMDLIRVNLLNYGCICDSIDDAAYDFGYNINDSKIKKSFIKWFKPEGKCSGSLWFGDIYSNEHYGKMPENLETRMNALVLFELICLDTKEYKEF